VEGGRGQVVVVMVVVRCALGGRGEGSMVGATAWSLHATQTLKGSSPVMTRGA